MTLYHRLNVFKYNQINPALHIFFHIMSFIIACNRNYYGENCSLSCPLNCKTCRHTDGCSTCKAGWMGSNCTSGNNNSIFFHSKLYAIKIPPPKKKDIWDFLKLKIQFHIYFFTLDILVKSDCNFFKACLNSYGENCRYSCSLHCTNQTCDRFNGSCLIGCVDGFYGKSCDRGNADWKTVMSMTHFI